MEFTDGYEVMHIARSSAEEVPYSFARSSIKIKGHMGQKNVRFWPELGISGLELQFEFNDGYKMMHKAWSRVEKVPYCFSRSSVKFQGHMWPKTSDLGVYGW